MQRTRPRLKLFNITCCLPECGKSAVRLYPTRPAPGLESTSPTAVPLIASGIGRGSTASGLPRGTRRTHALAPHCSVMIQPVFAPGPRKLYHNDACRERAKRERSRRQPAGDVRAARAMAFKAMQAAAVALQQAAAHAAGFAQWRATDYADVMRRFAKLKEKAAAKGREPTPTDAFIDLLDQTLKEGRGYTVWQEKMDEIAGARVRLAHRAATLLRSVEDRLARRAASTRRRRAAARDADQVAAVDDSARRRDDEAEGTGDHRLAEALDPETGLTASRLEALRQAARAGDTEARDYLRRNNLL